MDTDHLKQLLNISTRSAVFRQAGLTVSLRCASRWRSAGQASALFISPVRTARALDRYHDRLRAEAAGLRTGLYTSPYLVQFYERIPYRRLDDLERRSRTPF